MVASPLARNRADAEKLKFQSPSLRGSGRFDETIIRDRRTAGAFQSPSLRGSGRFGTPTGRRSMRRSVSIPFIAGQWSLPYLRPLVMTVVRRCFNPLHCGAVVASPRYRAIIPKRCEVSIPFIAGQWSLHRVWALFAIEGCVFQSPSLRGSGRFVPGLRP